jgi:hypothetical protein
MEVGALSSVSEVGVGLFLALALVQVVGAGRVSKLRRKADLLREVVRTNALRSERATVANINAQLLRLELQLEGLSAIFMKASFVLIALSIAGVAWVSLMPSLTVGCFGISIFVGFYLFLPVVAFAMAAMVIRAKSRSTYVEIEAVRTRLLSRV